jgi:hypothetical protein
VLPKEVTTCTHITSYCLTAAESALLNEHLSTVFNSQDLVVRLKDALEFHEFIDLCYKKMMLKESNASDKCGFFRINGESVVLYIVKNSVKRPALLLLLRGRNKSFEAEERGGGGVGPGLPQVLLQGPGDSE